MKLRHVVEEAVQELFAKLLAKPEGEWLTVTLTKGRTTAGRKVIYDRLQKMCQLMLIEYNLDPSQFRICKGFPNEWAQMPTSQQSKLYRAAIATYNGGNYRMVHGRQTGKSQLHQILRSMNKPIPRGKP
ncbi:hypothetical protein CPT_Piffle_023 [Stenotrophomonas phage Piffle]|uniref:Uncharacterized protein n=1 Tax=Stenotrophomonas phage Piffle TaxID=2859656 RepID=A0AAE7WP84_9CAUD|nr:hypothetical protein PP762_gp23 [Stenotrophomonas phage Piffle]QYW01883.1 hypothetical protein CPT_Piffle_023 [Stenotrophomonas phage Piffle]